MSLQFVFGSSGSGKSHKIYTEIIEDSMKNPNTNYIIIVPEQFTLQTQKNMVSMHPNNGILNIDVLSFVRLAYKIFSDIGYNPGIVLDDAGKNMILRKIMTYEEDKLVLFKGNIKKQGFISELKSLISEFGQYSISPEEIQKINENIEDNALKTKLQETSIVYKAFKEYLQEKYIMAEEVLDKLYNVLEKSKVLKDSVVCFDGFTGFTPIQYKLLVKIMKLCKKVYVTVTVDTNEVGEHINEYSLFGMSNTTINKLRGLANEAKIHIDADILVKDYIQVDGEKRKVGRFKSAPVLEYVEQHIFRYGKYTFKGKQDNISIHALANADAEVDYTIWRIKRLIRENNLRYRDIAIVTGDIETYGRIFNRRLEMSDIPYFIDNNKSIMDNPLVEMIRALFEVLSRNFSYESIFRFLRCGMNDYTREELDILENYVLAYGKKNKNHWKKNWVIKDSFYNEEVLEQVNTLRQSIYDLLNNASKSIKNNKTVKDISKGLYDFLVNIKAFDRIDYYEKYFEENNMPTKAKEFSQVYDIVIDLLDKIVDLLGDEVVTVKEYLEIFEAGIEEVKIGVIPMTIDQLVIGDIERTRLNDIKVLFFVGVNENIIPKNATKGGIISELDRELLADMGVELSPNKKQELFIEQFYLYMMLTKASEKLVITFSKLDSEGNSIKEAYFVDKILRLVEDLEIKEEKMTYVEALFNHCETDICDKNSKDYYAHILGTNTGLDYLAYGLRKKNIEDMSDEWKQLFLWYKNNINKKEDVMNMLNEAFFTNNDMYISKNVANLIYQNSEKSVTEIEKYASCAYAHFLNYGLRLKKRKQYEIELPDIGTIFHTTLDMFSKQLLIDKMSWEDITLDDCNTIVDRCVDEATAEYGGVIMHSSKRNEYMINRIKDISKRTIKTLKKHIEKGGFVPVGYEVRFSANSNLDATNIKLDNNETVGLRGAIDRLDVSQGEEEYVKVIDYKSSSKSFEPALFMEGIQLQLMVYMSVALDTRKQQNKNKKVRPAGVFYYTVDNPFIEKDEKIAMSMRTIQEDGNEDIDEIEKGILDKLTMKGIVNSDPVIIESLDESIVDEDKKLVPKAKSDVIKLSTTTKGEIKANSNAIDDRAFESLIEKTQSIVRQKAVEMKQGIIEKNPYKFGDKTPCQYCDYKSICNFDINLEDNNYKWISKKTMDDILNVLESEDIEDEQ
ncbi:MAG: helicase-exonuclease AddAB subunit AddB [Lachnospiraceae bacterium]|nr:helicase-exonuclease AddAB subunit AddB [Lachnospiraceae bacterium]